MKTITEYRGISDLVYAKLESDTTTAITYDEVKEFVGIAELSRTTSSENESHYYDNVPAVVVNSTGADEVSITASAIPFDVLAEITGQDYDDETGALIEGERTPAYFAIGYKTKKTDGTEILVWRYKGMFNIPDSNHKTEDDGTDAQGQEIVFTGISTTHEFTATGKKAKAMSIDTSVNTTMTAATFFDEVFTPDSFTSNS